MHRLSKLYSCALAATIASLGACASTDDVRQDLDPAGTYFIEWRAANDATAASAARAIEAITDLGAERCLFGGVAEVHVVSLVYSWSRCARSQATALSWASTRASKPLTSRSRQ